MREIKFRAWDRGRKEMIPFELIELPYSENVNLDGQFDGLIDRGYVLMQYTGLKDKNGVEIYEGDIVAINEPKEVFKVVFKDGSFYPSSTLLQKCDDSHNLEFYEIIGNIYENPELLGK